MKKEINPFAAKDGAPIEGKEPEFFKWEIKKAKKELSLLPKEEQKKIIASQKALAKRMNS